MECAEVKKLLYEYIDDTLDTRSKTRIEEHLSTCKSCSEELYSMRSYFKELGSLKKVSAPKDFIKEIHERLTEPSRIKKIMHTLFVPVRIKAPLELAGALAAVLIVIFIFYGIKPEQQRALRPVMEEEKSIEDEVLKRGADLVRTEKEESLKVDDFEVAEPPEQVIEEKKESLKPLVERDKEATTVSKPDTKGQPAPSSISAETPIELVLLIKADALLAPEEQYTEKTVQMRKIKIAEDETVRKSRALEEPESGEEADLRSSTIPSILSRIKNLVEGFKGIVISEEYLPNSITAQIPSVNYVAFIESLGQFGDIKEPIPQDAPKDKESIVLSIELIPPH